MTCSKEVTTTKQNSMSPNVADCNTILFNPFCWTHTICRSACVFMCVFEGGVQFLFSFMANRLLFRLPGHQTVASTRQRPPHPRICLSIRSLCAPATESPGMNCTHARAHARTRTHTHTHTHLCRKIRGCLVRMAWPPQTFPAHAPLVSVSYQAF